ncbi:MULTISPECIES: chemotaxis protein CheW [unclassified Sphingosinithalassobacter]|uniref:chemotaxis protein CheW n=1 Tax=unclassified Sphingosinithalassobacter TaxID=2676235 RepID=UPI00165E60A1|nr:chemotaxis protein CheW [Sphingosinithalassobacter sp. CS137]
MNTEDKSGDAVDRKIVTFTLGKQMFGIEMGSLIEIREWEEPTPIPTVPSFIKGVTNLRGNVVPVVGLAERLGWEPSAIHPRSCILVVSIGGKHAGFLVDEVTDIVNIGSQEVQPAPDVEIGEPHVIHGLVRIAARGTDGSKREHMQMVLLLDLDALSLTSHLDLAA